MQKAMEYCQKSQSVVAQAQAAHDPKLREALIADAQSWFLLAEIELWMEDQKVKQLRSMQ